MAQKLSVTIALEGGKLVEQQLEGIGQAGKKAFEDISAAAQKAGGFKNLKPEEVTAKLKDMGIVGKEAFDKISGAVASATRMETLVGVVGGIEKGFAGVTAGAAGLVRALGPIGAAAGLAGGAIVKAMTDAAGSINKIDQAAIKAGMSIEKFDQLRRGLGAAGMSEKGVAAAMSAIAEATEKGKLDQVAKDLEEIQKAGKQGLGFQGMEEFKRLIETARSVGPAAEAAQKALKSIGVGIAPSGAESLSALIAKLGDAKAGTAAFIEQLRQMPDSANRSKLAIDGFKEAGAELVQLLRTGAITEDQFKERLGGLGAGAAKGATEVDQAFNRMNTAWKNLKETAEGALVQTGAADLLIKALEGITHLLTPETWVAWKNSALDAINGIIDRLREAAAAIAKLFTGSAAQGGNTAPEIPGNAAGGLIGGRGSGTSDSNLAWVSRGEHIMPARAVQQPGVLALLEALRRTGGNLRGVMHGMGRFAAGGLVPRFAEGGLVGGMQHLGTVDLRTDHGTARLMASSSAVEQLTRLAVTKRMTSTGKKPGFIG